MQKQLERMLDQGISEKSSSPWMTPAVYLCKTSVAFQMCLDYREFNKQTAKGARPLPLPDEAQDHLAQSVFFSILDPESG